MEGKTLFIIYVTVAVVFGSPAPQPRRPDLLSTLDAYVTWSEQVSFTLLNTIVTSSTVRRLKEVGSILHDNLSAAIEEKKTELRIELEDEDTEKNVLRALEGDLIKYGGKGALIRLLIGTELNNHGTRLVIANVLFAKISKQMIGLVDLLETDHVDIDEQKLKEMVELTTAAETLFDTIVANFKSFGEIVADRPETNAADGEPHQSGNSLEAPLSRRKRLAFGRQYVVTRDGPGDSTVRIRPGPFDAGDGSIGIFELGVGFNIRK